MSDTPYEKMSTPKNQKIKKRGIRYYDGIRKENREKSKKGRTRREEAKKCL